MITCFRRAGNLPVSILCNRNPRGRPLRVFGKRRMRLFRALRSEPGNPSLTPNGGRSGRFSSRRVLQGSGVRLHYKTPAALRRAFYNAPRPFAR
ncbi:hypothetical protein Trebr_0472 [Treponema brennaborense DSM 12168]|uniref:Uncharacterized protein n=1 Tax=Treponema brennaborense (strain DSM 12168 / CIP 105900 / DD5/3) TaxID=906968 RepID=F4LP40_TREBD|nr:hypothetical protein Trebr_0472 [Treponema brennaborense DSM 12168]